MKYRHKQAGFLVDVVTFRECSDSFVFYMPSGVRNVMLKTEFRKIYGR